jgi:protein TonB
LALLCVAPGHGQDTERKILKKVEAQYPSILKRRGIGGTVRLKVLVHPDGNVKDVEVLGGNPALADAAEKAVRQWKFAPGGESAITVAVTFDPNS